MPRVTFIGAGSTVFALNLLRDLFLFPELRDCDIALMDIDPQRLADTEMVARRTAERMGARPTITATTDRRAALDGAQYVINMMLTLAQIWALVDELIAAHGDYLPHFA